jgi:hypothetical protein
MTAMTDQSRPYSKLRGIPEISVTSVNSEMIGKPGLVYGALQETGLWFANHPEAVAQMTYEQLMAKFRSHHRGVWDCSAAAGTAVHRVAECWVHRQTPDISVIVDDLAQTQAKLWQGNEVDAVEQVNALVNGLEKFWIDRQVRPVSSEEVVRLPGLYIGTRDLRATLLDDDGNRRLATIDFKTTSHSEEEKGVYLDEWTLQTVAYDRAPEIVHYEWPDGKPVEVATTPSEPARWCLIVHLRPNGTHKVYECPADDAAYEAFLGMCRALHWRRSLPKKPQAMRGPR